MTEGKNGIVRQAENRCHITKEQFCDWLAGEMPSDKEAEFLEHVGNCTFCAHQFADWMEAPPDLPVSQTKAAESSEISKGRNHAAEAASGRANERASQREVAADAVIYV